MPNKHRLTRSDIGAWVLKGNPDEIWDYFAALEAEGRPPGEVWTENWTIGRTYRTHLIEPDDLMVLWITGRRSPGIYELGTITSEPYEAEGIDETHLIDQSRARKATFVVDYESVLLKAPVARADLRSDPVLSGCEQFRSPMISNPTYLTPKQCEALAGYVPKTVLRRAGWKQYA